eukprot:5191707-Prymnesium_polylepis.2
MSSSETWLDDSSGDAWMVDSSGNADGLAQSSAHPACYAHAPCTDASSAQPRQRLNERPYSAKLWHEESVRVRLLPASCAYGTGPPISSWLEPSRVGR